MLPEKSKLQHIEGVRGLAAIIVVLHHYTLAFYPALNFGNSDQAHIGTGGIELALARTPFNILYNGGFAVCIFFILSGYVLSNAYHQHNDPKILIQYTIKRYFRLLVPVGVSILLAYIFIRIGFMNNTGLGDVTKTNEWLIGAFDKDGGFYDVLKNVFVDVFFFHDNKYNPVLWTMTYELLGSFLIFGFLLLTHPVKYKMSLYILLILALLFTDNNFYAAFIIGVLLNKYIWQKQELAFSIPRWVIVAILMIGLFLSSYPICNDPDKTMYGFITFSFLTNYDFYHVIGSFLVMFTILNSEKLKALLSGKIVSYVGKISFSFYLLHFIILCSLSCYLFKVFYPVCGYNVSVILSWLLSIPVIALTSHWYYKWIDRSGIKASEKVLGLFF